MKEDTVVRLGVDELGKGPFEKWIREPLGEIAHLELRPSLKGQQRRKAPDHSPERGAERHIADASKGKGLNPGDVLSSYRGIGRGQSEQGASQLIRIIIVYEPLTIWRGNGRAILERHEFTRHSAKLLPELVNAGPGLAAEEVVDAGVESVAGALPGSAPASWSGMHLEDLSLVAIQLALDAGRQTAHAGADNDDIHGNTKNNAILPIF